MENSERRKFLGKMALGASTIATWPIVSALTSVDEVDQKVEVIKKIRALGFQWETQDPFLFCVHHEDHYPKGNDELGPDASLKGRQLGQDFMLKDGWRMYHGTKVPGFPGHPHRGFETLTVVRKGLVDHSDSAGASGRYGNGDLQWMTAGKGLMHSEMFPLLNQEDNNPLELFQIWLNLPKKSKMEDPDFKMFWREDIPKFYIDNQNVYVEVLVGDFLEKKAPQPPNASWASVVENHVGVYNFHLEPGASFTLPKTEEDINRSIYFYEGQSIEINETDVAEYHAADVLPHYDIVISNTSEKPCKILVLQGKPINEPVVQHGPFVMNNKKEIREAFRDYQKDQFGGWPWPDYDQVHGKENKRFAKFSNGEEVFKDEI